MGPRFLTVTSSGAGDPGHPARVRHRAGRLPGDDPAPGPAAQVAAADDGARAAHHQEGLQLRRRREHQEAGGLGRDGPAVATS